MRNPIPLWRARREVVMSAKLVESSYEPGLGEHEFDPDDLADLVATVRRLRNLERPS